mmetsp:Transcript_4338/g.10363  ORF Transcript_4338/g.10363 Transcript_4338/m.10363 type:complete len:96 (+) Transcript_4338:255-542(+)
MCVSPAPLGHLGGTVAASVINIKYAASIASRGRRFQQVFVDQYADHFHHCYFWQCTHPLISAAPTRRQGAYHMAPRAILNGGWYISSDQGFFWGE